MVFGAFFYFLTFSYPPRTVAFPRFLLLLFFILSVLLFIFPGEPQKYSLREVFSSEKSITVLLLIAYTILFPLIGFFITTFFFAVFYMWLFRRKGLRRYLLIAAVYVAVIYMVFQKLLYVWFPEGWLL
jgi:uncharacterized BrkB/YihY/UPF0761 family membrane protein